MAAAPIIQFNSLPLRKTNTKTTPKLEATTLTLEPLPHHLHSLIPKFTTLRELKQIQAYAIKTHSQNDSKKLTNFCTSGSNLTNASIDHAQNPFDKITEPDLFLFNNMARAYAGSDDPLKAILLFSHVWCSGNGILPNYRTFFSLFKACSWAKAFEEGKQLHCLAVKLGVSHNTYVCPTLINMYSTCGYIDAAIRVFDKIHNPRLVAYNAIITCLARHRLPYEAFALFREMQEIGLEPDEVTMLAMLSSCTLLRSLDFGRWMHGYVKKNGFDRNEQVNAALINLYAKCGTFEDVAPVFRDMQKRETQVSSAMAYATHGHS